MKKLIKQMVVLVAIVSATSAYGVATLRLSTDGGATWTTTVDGDADGVVTFSGGLGSWIVNVTTGITKPALGDASAAEVDLNSVDVSSSAGGTLLIQFSDTDFAGPNPGAFKHIVGGTTSGTITATTWGDNSNVLFANDGLTAQSTLGPFGAGAFSGTTTAPADAVAGDYSLTIQASIVHTGAGATSFNDNLRAAPEGGMTLILLGSSMACLGYLRRKLAVKA